jgi:hypothetical protein
MPARGGGFLSHLLAVALVVQTFLCGALVVYVFWPKIVKFLHANPHPTTGTTTSQATQTAPKTDTKSTKAKPDTKSTKPSTDTHPPVIVPPPDHTPKETDLVVGPGHNGTIAEALRKAAPGAEIKIMGSKDPYRESIVLSRGIKLVGEGRQQVVVIADKGPALKVEAEGGSVSGLTLVSEAGQGNTEHFTVEISQQGKLVLESCDIAWKEEAGGSQDGVCVHVTGAATDLTLKECRLHDGARGLWVEKGALPKVEGCTFEKNLIGVYVDEAGGVFNTCTIRDNDADNVFVSSTVAEVTLQQCTVRGGKGNGVMFANKAKGKLIGGSIQEIRGNDKRAFWIKDKASVRLEGCEVANNHMGILVEEGGEAVLSRCKIHDNTGTALAVKGADSRLDASKCLKEDVRNNGSPKVEDKAVYLEPNG